MYSNVNQGMRYKKYYKKNILSNFDLNYDSKFMDSLFWYHVHDNFTT